MFGWRLAHSTSNFLPDNLRWLLKRTLSLRCWTCHHAEWNVYFRKRYSQILSHLVWSSWIMVQNTSSIITF